MIKKLQFTITVRTILVGALSSTMLLSCAGQRHSHAVVENLAERILPVTTSKQFAFEKLDNGGLDKFELRTKNGKVLVKGNTPVAMASGLNWYLKYHTNSSVSWSGNQIDLPKSLPQIEGSIIKESAFEHAYYLNYCTFNYTMSFWDWDRWEQEIDWMALNGINLPLAITGTEAVWYNVLKRLNYSETEILEFIPGPAFTS